MNIFFYKVYHFCFKTEDYERIMKTGCSKQYVQFNSLESAKVACAGDTNCIAIQDYYCNGDSFRICTEGFSLRASCSSIAVGCDCAYKKANLRGKSYISLPIHRLHAFKNWYY